MRDADRIYDELENLYARWGLNENPFSESASTLLQAHLKDVFTGREKELRDVFGLFKSRERKRLFVYGWVGIGKTAFILEVLGVLQRKDEKTLAAYISLPPNTDLATAALVALAREMPKDEWAQHQLHQMGLRPRSTVQKRKTTEKLGTSGTGFSTESETMPVNKPQIPALSFEDLLERALQEYDRVVIAVDDLDKQDPGEIRKLLHNAQGMLKGGAWFILTGHASGLTREVLTVERGLFDLSLELKELDLETTFQMLVNYLNSARIDGKSYSVDDPKAVFPFTPEAARMLCERSGGVPRWLNRLAGYVLVRASELKADEITPEILEQGFEYADKQLRTQPGLTPEDLQVLEFVIDKGVVSDENVKHEELNRMRHREFDDVVPTLEKLIQMDLVRRVPSEPATTFEPSPLLREKPEKPAEIESVADSKQGE